MKKIKTKKIRGVKCPVTKEIQMIETCKDCDAYKGLTKLKEIKCIVDEF